MTATDSAATPALTGKAAAAAEIVRLARDGELTIVDVPKVREHLYVRVRPLDEAKRGARKPSALDDFAVHTGGLALAAVMASAIAVAPVIPRPAVGALALSLIVLAVYGLAACARRRARTRTQGR